MKPSSLRSVAVCHGKTATTTLFFVLFLMAFVRSVNAQQDTTNLFTLSIEQLMDLSVDISTAMKSTTRSDETPAAVFVITRDDMDNMGLSTVSEALNFVPGFTVGKTIQSGQQNNIYVRGALGSQSEGILFLYNGQRLNDGITGGATAFSLDYPLDNIRQIEIVRGPVSALYGANAFVAVVNLVPYRADEIHSSSFSAQGGTRGALRIQGQQPWKIGSLYGSFFGSIHRFDDATGQRDTRVSIYDSLTSSFKPKILNDRTNAESSSLYQAGLSLAYGKFQADAYINRSLGTNNWGTGATSSQKNFENRHLTGNEQVGIKYTDQFARKHRITVIGGFANHWAENIFRVENFRSIFYPGFEPAGNLSLLETDLGTSTINFESYAEFNFSKRHRTVVGVNVQKDFINTIDFSTAILDRNGDGILDGTSQDDTLDTVFKRESSTVYAGFIQHTWDPVDKLSLTGGARIDHYNDFGSKLSPRMTFVYHPLRPLIITGMVGKAFRAPSFFETTQSDFSSIGGNHLVENKSLKPETITTYELQLSVKPKDNLSVTANFFYNDMQQVIRQVQVNQPGLPTQSKWENVGSRDWKGAEISLRFAPGHGLSLFGNYSYTQTTDERVADKEDPVFGIPKHALNVAVHWSKNKIGLNVNAHSRFGWNDVPAYSTPNIILEKIDLKAYAVLNARFTVRNVWKSVDLLLDVRNLTDAKYFFADDRFYVPQGIAGNRRMITIGAEINY